MDSASSFRLPAELWGYILEEAILFDGNMAFQTTCSPETYLSFKATCGHAQDKMKSYHRSEVIKRMLRLVCRSWNSILDDWRYKSRWTILSPVLSNPAERHLQLYLPLRADLEVPWGSSHDLFRLWNSWDPWPKGPIRLVRLELLNIREDFYPNIFDGLIKASGNLSSLRSLAIFIRLPNPGVLDILSQSFSHLTHLTLKISYNRDIHSQYHPKDVNVTGKGVLALDRLEVLFFHLSPGIPDTNDWHLPQLHTFHSIPFIRGWKKSIYPLLQRHGSTLQTLDLEELPNELGFLTSDHQFTLPVGFWSCFPLLRLLRINLRYTTWTEFPEYGHPLEWLVHSHGINYTFEFVEALGLLARYREGGCRPKIGISGSFSDRITARRYSHEVGNILRGLERNGTELGIMHCGEWRRLEKPLVVAVGHQKHLV